MPRTQPPDSRFVTLAWIIKRGGKIVATCRHCDTERAVGLQMLVQRLGADFKPGEHIERFQQALKCTSCGLKGAKVEFRIPAPNMSTSPADSFPW